MDFTVQSKNKRKRKDKQILGPCQRLKTAVEHDIDCSWRA